MDSRRIPRSHSQEHEPVAGTLRQLRRPALGSFTLIEVVISIAVIVVIIVSLLGMMSYITQLVKRADNYARLSDVSGQVLANLSHQPYVVVSAEASTNASFYFTYDGLPTNSTSAYFQCSVTNYPSTVSNVTNLEMIQVSVRYPKPVFTTTNLIITSILNYD